MAANLQTIEQRFSDIQGVIDLVKIDLSADMGIEDPGDVDPEDFAEATRHYLNCFNRLQAAQSELIRSGLAIDPTWQPPVIESP